MNTGARTASVKNTRYTINRRVYPLKISRRAESIAPFYALEFGKRAAALELLGHDVIRLSIGEPDFGAPPAVLKALRSVANGRPLPYTPSMGLPALRSAIALFYKNQHDVDVDPGRVMITAGASGALVLAMAALVNDGDQVLIGDPSYPCNRQIAESFGAEVTLVPTSAANQFQLTAQSVQANWSARTGGLMIASPSNPTGTTIPTGELKQILEFVRLQGAWCVVDEIYLNLGDHDNHDRAAGSVLSIDSDAIVINSFSKYFGMTGWRLGWVVLPQWLVPAMERLAQNYFLCASTPAQQAALACFTEESVAVCEDRRREFLVRRQIVVDGLRRIGLPSAAEPTGAFYVYFDVSHTGLSSWEFCERALNEVFVALTPGTDFGIHTAATHVRLSYAASAQDLHAAIDRLHDFLDGLHLDR
ncbi:MAG: aminotransferase class I/II-fold pyridoxal phosphate-dependent enzyme [Hyphomicrobiales bacterium]|nr:MAG: aminotransferase class I/II-fold pyridoxal phosphate-dependent enzyme [Hyphomicrobiales bacterium]